MCKHLKYKSFGIKQRIYTEGEEGDAFYLILSGRVGLYINTNKEGKIRLNSIAELKEGDCLGESSLLYGSKHTASAITTTNAELMILTKEEYDLEFRGDELLVHQKILKFYKKQFLFQRIPDEKLDFIATKTKKAIEYQTSDVIFKQGSLSEAFFFIAKGRAQVVKRLDFKKKKSSLLAPTARDYEYKQYESKIIEIEEIAKGSLVGAYEALRNLPYNTSVICTMPCSVYKVSLQDLRLLDFFETQILVNSTINPLSDEDIRSQYMNETLWSNYKTNYIESVRKEKKFKERFNFRMAPINWYKGRSITPENMFGMPRSHLRLDPIDKLIPLSRSVLR